MSVDEVCPVCVIKVLSTDKSIQCDGLCDRWFHKDCVKMTATEYARYANDDKLKWECGRNDCIKPEAQPQNLLLNQLTILTSKITELAGKVDSLSALPSKLDNITAKLDELNSNFASLENRVGNNEIKIKTIEDRLENISVTPATNPELIIAESNERAYRAKNIMIYELPESDSRDVSVRKKHDVDLAVKLFNGVRPDVVLDVCAAVRVGKKTPNKPRPLKIVLDNETNARLLIRSFTSETATQLDQLFSSVKVSRDRTPREMQYFKTLASELEKRKSAGEKDLTITYKNNVPQIVKLLKNDQIPTVHKIE